MKKFKLTQNDATSLESATSLMSNPVLKNASIDVANASLTGGFVKVSFCKLIKVEQ